MHSFVVSHLVAYEACHVGQHASQHFVKWRGAAASAEGSAAGCWKICLSTPRAGTDFFVPSCHVYEPTFVKLFGILIVINFIIVKIGAIRGVCCL